MAVDYNLVIVGGSLVARHAARCAARWRARVALVEPPRSSIDWEQEQLQLDYLQGSYRRQSGNAIPQARLTEARAFAAWQLEQSSVATLAASGIDVVIGSGTFVCRPRLGVQVGDRLLRGHHYLIAANADPWIPPDLGRLGVASLQQLPFHHSPTVAVWGAKAHGVFLAQVLRRLGLPVVLASPALRLLPEDDLPVAELFQAQLEAEGIRVLTAASLIQASPETTALPSSQPPITIQAGSLSIAADRVMPAAAYRPSVSTLDLPPQVRATPYGIPVDACLQTAHPRIYACGYAIDAYRTLSIAKAEAEIAVANALSLPFRRIRYRTIPQILSTDPPRVQIGMTEVQARRTYGNITVLHRSTSPLARPQRHGTSAGLCRLVLSHRGVILGACAVGPGAQDWINVLTQAVIRRATLQSLPIHLPHTAHGVAVAALRDQWQQQRRPWLWDGLELVLNWRRDWSQ